MELGTRKGSYHLEWLAAYPGDPCPLIYCYENTTLRTARHHKRDIESKGWPVQIFDHTGQLVEASEVDLTFEVTR